MRCNATWIGALLLSAILFACTALYGATGEEEPHDALYEVSAVLAKGDIDAAMGMLNKLVAQYPRSRQVRDFRANTSLFLGQGEEALADFEFILAMTPDDTSVMLRRCAIFEAMGQSNDVLRPCYIDVVETKRRTLFDSELAQDTDYVLAAMLSELPEAEAIKQEYLELIDSKYRVYNGTLDKGTQEQLISQDKDAILHFDRSLIKKTYDVQRDKYKHMKTRAQ